MRCAVVEEAFRLPKGTVGGAKRLPYISHLKTGSCQHFLELVCQLRCLVSQGTFA